VRHALSGTSGAVGYRLSEVLPGLCYRCVLRAQPFCNPRRGSCSGGRLVRQSMITRASPDFQRWATVYPSICAWIADPGSERFSTHGSGGDLRPFPGTDVKLEIYTHTHTYCTGSSLNREARFGKLYTPPLAESTADLAGGIRQSDASLNPSQ
jgi:hypothetical protein